MVTISKNVIDKEIPQSLFLQVKEAIRERILAGELPPGSRIPTSKILSKEIGVGVVTTEKAITGLVKEGLLYRLPHHGTFVTNKKENLDVLQGSIVYIVLSTIYSVTDPLISLLFKGFRENPLSQRYNVQILSLEGMQLADRSLENYLSMLKKHLVAGVVLASPITEKEYEVFLRSKVPIVAQWKPHNHRELHYVTSSSQEAGKMVTRYLLGLGHRRVALLLRTFSDHNHTIRVSGFQQFFQGYGKIMRENEIFRPALCTTSPYGETFEDREVSYEAINRLLSLSPLPTAIIAGDDILARAVLEVAEQKGIRVPEDLSLVGSGNMLGNDGFMTTVDPKYPEIAKLSLDLLHKIIQGERTKRSIVLEPALIIKKSARVLNSSSDNRKGKIDSS